MFLIVQKCHGRNLEGTYNSGECKAWWLGVQYQNGNTGASRFLISYVLSLCSRPLANETRTMLISRLDSCLFRVAWYNTFGMRGDGIEHPHNQHFWFNVEWIGGGGA